MKRVFPFLPLLLGACISQSVFAQESAIRARAGVGAVNYVAPIGAGSPDLKSDYMALSLGGSYITAGGWFGDLALRTSLGAEWNAGEVIGGIVGVPAIEDQDFSRIETTLTGGKSLGDGLSVFGGIQVIQAKADIDVTIFGINVNETITVDDTVLFAGLAKSIPIGVGALNLSGALGIMKETTSSTDPTTPKEKSDSGLGYSLGAAYSRPLGNWLSIQADVRYQSYSVEYQGEKSDQKVTAISAALVGQF